MWQRHKMEAVWKAYLKQMSWVFLSFSQEEAPALGPWGHKTLRLWLDGRYIYLCTSSMVDKNTKTGKMREQLKEKLKGKFKDSTLNENNLKYKYN